MKSIVFFSFEVNVDRNWIAFFWGKKTIFHLMFSMSCAGIDLNESELKISRLSFSYSQFTEARSWRK